MASKMASVLFTDMVASTELWLRLGDSAAGEVRAWHDQLLTAAITEADGRVVKGLGDGIMAVFDAASDAVRAATTIQQRLLRDVSSDPDRRFDVRIGISAGDVELTDDDCFGTAVIESSRLCSSAQGGQILVADLVRALSRGRRGHVFESVGSLALKGLDGPVPASRVVWTPLDDPSGAPVPFPPVLRPTSTVRYVGRQELLDGVRGAWKEAASGGARLLLLAGEPGIGKTRTAAELALEAHGEGAVVLYGRCDEHLGVPYQPFVEALDWYARHAKAPALGRYAGDLRRLVPDLDRHTTDLPPAISSDPQTEEHRVLQAVADWLSAASAANGLVVVLDDLHWASPATLRMLVETFRHASADDTSGLLLLATYRDTDIDRTTPLTSVLADLRRLSGVERWSIHGFRADEVVTFVEQAAGHELDEEMRALTRSVHAETEGNPFFVSETLRHLVETGQARFADGRWSVATTEVDAVPEGVRDVVGRRLDALSAAAVEILTAGAVLGRSFRWAVLCEMVDQPVDDVADVLDEALRARLVEEQGPEELRFVHALVRTSLLQELSAIRLRRLHQRATQATATVTPDAVTALARHSVAAAPSGAELIAAVEYCLRAGIAARRSRAPGEAVHHLTQAAELLGDIDDAHLVLRARVLSQLGQAQRDEGGHDHRATLRTAAALALEAHDLDLAVEVLTVQSRGFLPSVNGEVDAELVGMLRTAVTRVGHDRPAVRARLLAALSLEQFYDPEVSVKENARIAEEAIALAETDGDPRLLAEVLLRTNMAWAVPANWPKIPEIATRLRVLAEEIGDPALRVGASFVSLRATMYLDDFDAAEMRCAEGLELARQANPELESIFQFISVTFPMLRGEIDEAELRLTAAEALADHAKAPDRLVHSSGSRYVLGSVRHEFGSGFLDAFLAFADALDTAITRIGSAALHALHRPPEEGLERIERFALYEASAARDDLLKPYGLCYLGLTAFELDQPSLGASVHRELAPFRDLMATVIFMTVGPIRPYLVIAGAAAGHLDEAIAEIDEAIHIVRRDAPVFEPYFASFLARIPLRRGRSEDAEQAGRIIADALEVADRFGMPAWRPDLEALLANG